MKLLIKYLWLPILVFIFILSFELKYNLVGVTFILLIVQSVIGLSFSLTRSVNLLSVYFIFTLVFLNLLPWLHYSGRYIIWRSFPIFDSTYVTVNMIIILANALVFLTYRIFLKKSKQFSQREATEKNIALVKLILLLLSTFGFVLVFYLNDFSIIKLFFRGIIDEQRVVVVESSAVSLLLGLTARLTPVFCFYYAFTQLKGGVVTKSCLFLLMVLSVFPTGVARYMAAFVYIPLMLLFVPATRSATAFAAMLLISLFFIFPFLNQFRYFSEFRSLRLLPSEEFFYAAHFDAYENFASAVEGNFISHGEQLLGSLLFFVPRLIWSDKPVGSGYEMASQFGYQFKNISMPFLGEGYVNFGIVGVVLFAVLIGYSMAKLDSVFGSRVRANGKVNYSTAIYYFMIGAIFFLLRGDLMSSVAYISAGLIVALFIRWIIRFKNLLLPKNEKYSS